MSLFHNVARISLSVKATRPLLLPPRQVGVSLTSYPTRRDNGTQYPSLRYSKRSVQGAKYKMTGRLKEAIKQIKIVKEEVDDPEVSEELERALEALQNPVESLEGDD